MPLYIVPKCGCLCVPQRSVDARLPTIVGAGLSVTVTALECGFPCEHHGAAHISDAH